MRSSRAVTALVVVAVLVACGTVKQDPASSGLGAGGSAGEGAWPERPSAPSAALVTRKLGAAGVPRDPSVAFSGETLAVASVAGIYAPRVVVTIEPGSALEQVELTPAEQVGHPGLAPFAGGFRVGWWSGSAGTGKVELQGVGADAALGPTLRVADGLDVVGCDLADLGDATAVACGGNLLSVCGAEACSRITLPACESVGDARIAADGAAITLARLCAAGDVIEGPSTSLLLARFSATGEPLLDVLEVARTPAFEGRPALAVVGAHTWVAFAGVVHHLDAQGQHLSAPVIIQPAPEGLPGKVANSELSARAGALLVLSSFWGAVTMEFDREESVLVELTSELSPLGELTRPGGSYRHAAMATSSGGRRVLARELGATVAVHPIDLEASKLEAPSYVDGLISPPRVEDVYCEGEACRLLLRVEGLAPEEGDQPARTSEFALGASSSDALREVWGQSDCARPFGCDGLFTTGDATVLLDHGASVRWILPEGFPAWEEPLPSDVIVRGPFNRAAPYVVVEGPSPQILRLDEASARTAPLGGPLYPVVYCDAGVYALGYGLETTFTPVAGGPTFTLSGTGTPVCLADQLGLITDSAFQRLSLDGGRLSDVPLAGVRVASGGDDGDALIVTSTESTDPSAFSRRFTVQRIPPFGPAKSRTIELPEAGLVDGVWASGGRVHLAWWSDRGVWLSSLALD